MRLFGRPANLFNLLRRYLVLQTNQLHLNANRHLVCRLANLINLPDPLSIAILVNFHLVRSTRVNSRVSTRQLRHVQKDTPSRSKMSRHNSVITGQLRRQGRQRVDLTTDNLISFNVDLRRNSRIVHRLVSNILMRFTRVRRHVNRHLVIQRPISVQRRPFSHNRLRIFSRVLNKLMQDEDRRRHLNARPTQQGTFNQRPRHVRYTAPRRHNPKLNNNAHLVRRIHLASRLTLFSDLVNLLLSRLANQHLHLHNRLTLRHLRVLKRARRLSKTTHVPTSAEILTNQRLLLRQRHSPRVQKGALSRFQPRRFKVGLHALNNSNHLNRRVYRVKPTGNHTVLVRQQRVQLLLQTQTQRVQMVLISPIAGHAHNVQN